MVFAVQIKTDINAGNLFQISIAALLNFKNLKQFFKLRQYLMHIVGMVAFHQILMHYKSIRG